MKVKKSGFYEVLKCDTSGMYGRIFYLSDYPDGGALAAAFEYVNQYGGKIYRDNKEVSKNK